MLTDDQQAFIEANPSAAMITVGKHGTAKAVRVSVGLVDRRLWSSGTEGRVRTARLRQDPRATLFVFGAGYSFLTLETTVRIREGKRAAEDNVRLFRLLQNKPSGALAWVGEALDESQFLARMIDEQRVIYEFAVERAYGML